MKNTRARAILAVTFCLLAVPSWAQAQAIPRAPDGKPDLSGLWQAFTTASWNIQDHSASPDAPAGQGIVEGNEIPYRPEALAKRTENFKNRATADPEKQCYMPGVPRAVYMPFPFQIFQTPEMLIVLHEYAHTVRYVYTNGTKHPEGHIDWWMGDSRARWEGDTLVVDVIHLNDRTWFDRAGNHHSKELHVVERYTPMGPDHIRWEATIEDPQVFTRPWKMSTVLYRRKEPNVRLLEYECYGFEFENIYPYPELAEGSR